MKVVASIGCTDPWNAAGLGLDIRALSACGVRPVSVVAGVTAQDARGVHAALAMPPELIAAQLDALGAASIAAYRVGALLDPASVTAVARYLRTQSAPAVYDPVVAPSGGGTFADAATLAAICRDLVPAVKLVTPNLAEAALLTGAPVASRADMERAAAALVRSGASAALVTGGHLTGVAADVLVDAAGLAVFEAPRLAGSLRGTGCLLACGIAAALAKGHALREAVVEGRSFVRERFEQPSVAGSMQLAF